MTHLFDCAAPAGGGVQSISAYTAVLSRIPHSNCCKRVPNRPPRPRECQVMHVALYLRWVAVAATQPPHISPPQAPSGRPGNLLTSPIPDRADTPQNSHNVLYPGYSVTDHGMQSRRAQSRRQSVLRLVACAAVGHRRLAGPNTPPRRWSSQSAYHRRGGPGRVVVLLPPVARGTARGVRLRLGAPPRPLRALTPRDRHAHPVLEPAKRGLREHLRQTVGNHLCAGLVEEAHPL